MTSVRSNNIGLTYQRFTTLGSKDVGIRKSECVTKNQFLYPYIKYIVRMINIMCVEENFYYFLIKGMTGSWGVNYLRTYMIDQDLNKFWYEKEFYGLIKKIFGWMI